MTNAGVGELKAIRVGHNLQEDVHLVEDGSQSWVGAIICHNLLTESQPGDNEQSSWSQASSKISADLLGKPGAAGLCDPFSGVDSSVDPDGRTVGSTCAELRQRKGTRFHPLSH